MTPEEIFEAVRSVSEQIPFNHHLGLRVEEFGEDRISVVFDARPELVGNFATGVLHGGVISSTLDLVGGLTALSSVLKMQRPASLDQVGNTFSRFGTIDLRVDYLRPGAGASFRASGTTLRAGRRVVVTRMEMHNELGELIALGTGTYMTG
ncbi:MAG: thioesterase family protein [Acidimicrobiia bacterium]|nr:thioesterase family protein [Acidimicrobiia bacterium]